MLEKILFGYILLINLISVILSIVDKLFAIKNMWRISEKCLFTVALLGGAAGMYITNLLIRHKTKHKRFMLGLPLIIFFQFILVVYCILDKI